MIRQSGLTGLFSVFLLATAATGAGAQDAYFQDDFDSDLGAAWEVTNPNPDNFIVEDGVLLALANSTGTFAENNVANIFRLTSGLPEGDWIMEIAFEAELQTAREQIFIGVADGNERMVLASIYTRGDNNYGWGLNLQLAKAGAGKATRFDSGLASMGCNICPADRKWPNFVATIAQPIVMQLEKTGRQYIARAKLGGPNDDWQETFTLTDLRGPQTPVLYVKQYQDNDGESLFLIDYFKITAK
jgi:hypothetical protein